MFQRVEDTKDKITPEQFCYWFKGFLEVADPEKLNAKQLQIVKDHLDLVFNKVTPNYSNISKITYAPGVRDFTKEIPSIDYPIFPNQTIC